ncbi:MAG: hypothetical protein LBE59_06910 [Nevskiaceae bacterium]|jgi:hypothetical protein|nr:hypothetical protein [Nevskiaceae bacterium]
MSLETLAQSIHAWGIAEWMRSSLKAMPVIESIHVMAITLVFGSILVVDLRLLGLLNANRAFTRIAHELLRLTWGAFAVAAITGALLFTPNSITYYHNTAFRLKMLAILAAGINMAIFEFRTVRGVATWDTTRTPPAAARLAGLLSIVLWVTVIILGRWIGFSKGYDFSIPEEVQFEF